MRLLRPGSQSRLKMVRLLLLDVDGVLTDGSIIYNDRGEETKIFNVRDGLGLRLLMQAGIAVGIVTGRGGPALMHRLKNLGIELVFTGVQQKDTVWESITQQTGLAPDQVAFMGDDIPDLALMRRVGFAIAVADAHPMVLAQCDAVTTAPGGHGAVREACESILKGQQLWEKALEQG